MRVQLPDEIVEDILRLACTLPALPDDRHRDPPPHDAERLKARSSLPKLDIPTTLKLLRLSPQHYPFIASILYKGPRLSDPISLSLFARTITTRPALGRLVKHLWVGHTYQGEALPINALNFGLGGCQAAYALNETIATIGEVRQCLRQGVPPTNILSPAFEKRIAQWAAFHVQGNSRTIDPSRAPRGIHIDAPGSGDPDARGYHWIGVDEWMLRLWDGRDLVKQLREVAQRAWWLELQRLQKKHAQCGHVPVKKVVPQFDGPPTSMLGDDLSAPFAPRGPELRRPGTDDDPMDWGSATEYPAAESTYTSTIDPSDDLSDSSPVYSEALDLDEIDAERDRCFEEMGVKRPAWRSQSWSEIATIGDQKVEWWLVWLIAKTRARGRFVARRVWEAEMRQNPTQSGWKPTLPFKDLNTKNHFTHPTLFARSGASHLLIGGAPPSERNDLWNGARTTDNTGLSSSDSDSDSNYDYDSDDSDYFSDRDTDRPDARRDLSMASVGSSMPRLSPRPRTASSSLPLFTELELSKNEDQADLWGGENIFASGNERAGAGNSVLGSRGGMFGYHSALRTGVLDEAVDGLDDGTGFASLQKQQTALKNEQDRLLSEMTLGSILSSLRTILLLTPKLRNLALDGVLERAVCGRRPMSGMGKLKTMSLGPPPPYWSSPLLFGHPVHMSKRQRRYLMQERRGNVESGPEDEGAPSSVFPIPGILVPSPCFATLQTLHITGCMLFPSEAKAIGGFGGQLPNLRHFRWSLWQPHVEGHPVGVVETLCAVMDIPTNEEALAAAAATGSSASLPSTAATASSSSTTTGRRSREMRKRQRRLDDTSRIQAGHVGMSGSVKSQLLSTMGTEAHTASLHSLLTRKRKLRSVYATLHAIDEAIFARKAPPALRYDPRLKIDTSACENLPDNLKEMAKWWEWESGMLDFKPTAKNLKLFMSQSAEEVAATAAAAAAAAVSAAGAAAAVEGGIADAATAGEGEGVEATA